MKLFCSGRDPTREHVSGRSDNVLEQRRIVDVSVQNKRTLLPLKKMEQIEIAYPFSLTMTDKEFDAVVCWVIRIKSVCLIESSLNTHVATITVCKYYQFSGVCSYVCLSVNAKTEKKLLIGNAYITCCKYVLWRTLEVIWFRWPLTFDLESYFRIVWLKNCR